jgi:hypothetical protein
MVNDEWRTAAPAFIIDRSAFIVLPAARQLFVFQAISTVSPHG